MTSDYQDGITDVIRFLHDHDMIDCNNCPIDNCEHKCRYYIMDLIEKENKENV